jgi:DNA-binding Xre family transcriptional regulator
METTYKKLWKILIDRDMSKSDLRDRAHISSVTLAKLGKGESVTTGILVRICHVLDCNIGDIVDVIPEDKENAKK